MKNFLQKFTLFLIALLLFPSIGYAQNSATLSISNSCTACTLNSTVSTSVSISVQSGVLGAVEVNLNYDQTKLKFNSISYDASLDTALEEGVSENVGVIHVVRGKTGGFTGSGRIFTVNFTAIAVGSAALSLSPVDGVDSNGDRMMVNGASATLTITEAPTGGGGTTGGGGGGTTTQPVVHDYTKSTVVFDKETALADGADRICLVITVKDKGVVVKNLRPVIVVDGGADKETPKLSGSEWRACVWSSQVGVKKITVKASTTIIGQKDVIFTAPIQPPVVGEPELPVEEPLESEKPVIKLTGKVEIGKDGDRFKNEITDLDLVRIYGTAPVGSTVRLYIHSNENLTREVVANDKGEWSVLLDKPLSAGFHRVDGVLVDKYGNESRLIVLSKFEVVSSSNRQIYLIGGGALIMLILAGTWLAFWLRQRKIQRSTTQNQKMA
jgi:hypothetical protein